MNFTLRQRMAFGWLGVLLALGVVVWMLAPVLSPFLVGAIAAYALHPAAEALAKRGVPRTVAVLLVILVAALALACLLLLTMLLLTWVLTLALRCDGC